VKRRLVSRLGIEPRTPGLRVVRGRRLTNGGLIRSFGFQNAWLLPRCSLGLG
jgi:hypothetical protein